MTPREKAKELIEKFHTSRDVESYNDVRDVFAAYRCAIIAVDEILDSYTKEKSYGYIISDKIIPYWEQVKEEINKL
jgi:hypothetical protein